MDNRSFFLFFLGYVAHIIPFTAFLVPIYLLKTKAVKQLSCTRIILRSFGFTMLIIGLCVVSMLLLSSNTFYLSGGVLGGSLVVNWFYPVLGKFGSILIGFVLALIGFIFLFWRIINSINCYILSLANNEK